MIRLHKGGCYGENHFPKRNPEFKFDQDFAAIIYGRHLRGMLVAFLTVSRRAVYAAHKEGTEHQISSDQTDLVPASLDS